MVALDHIFADRVVGNEKGTVYFFRPGKNLDSGPLISGNI